MTQTIAFNTGRKYTAEGQPIVATLHEDGVVTFMDHARGIDGEFSWTSDRLLNSVEVMHRYDTGAYRATARSSRDGMMRGGCNTQRAEV